MAPPTVQPGEPPLDYSDDIAPMAASTWTLLGLATLAIVLRFISKRLLRARLQIDDYLVLLALIFHHGLFAASTVAVIRGGVGRDMRLVAAEDPNNIVVLLKSFFAGEVMYGLSNTAVKLSVIAFYHRIFPTKRVKMGCYLLGGMSISWLLAVEITVFCQCRPLQAFWHVELQELPTTKCIDPILFFLANSSFNTVIDLAVIILPIRQIAKLHASRKKKMGIASVFLLGSIAFAASLTRTILKGVMFRNGVTNFTKQVATSGTATVIEVYVAIIGACLPSLVPIYRQLRYGDPLKTGSIRSSSKKSTGDSYSNSNNSSNRGGKNKSFSGTDTIGSGGGGLGQGSLDRLHDRDNVVDDYVTADYLPSDGSAKGERPTGVHASRGILVGRKVEISTTPDPWYDGSDEVGGKSGLDLPLQGIVVRKDLSWDHDNSGFKV